MENFQHISVFEEELVDSLKLSPGDIAIDCTAGGGGHTHLILQRIKPGGTALAFDRDPWAIKTLSARFSEEIARGELMLIRDTFSNIERQVEDRGLKGKISGICADIGVSSPQLDFGERGFSFSKDGPLDMRMDPTQGDSAADIVNNLSLDELTKIFREFGEDPHARKIAKTIVERRTAKPFSRTSDLAETVAGAIHYKERSKKHPATRIFQALRISVNNELGELRNLIDHAPYLLKSGGRLSVITFHSLEDRLVKHTFKRLSEGKQLTIDKRLPLTEEQLRSLRSKEFGICKPFPMIPTDQEQADNPRSRSAKLRTIERYAEYA